MVYERPLFQGAGSRPGAKLIPKTPKKKLNDDLRNSKSHNERRRKSLQMSKNFASSEQMKHMLSDAIDESILKDGTAEERLQAIMTKAKEQGVTLEKTFLPFTLGRHKATYVSSQQFQQAILKLASQNSFIITTEEITSLMKRFDIDGNGIISLLEYKYYCLTNIASVSWKAERQRLERSGEMERLRERMNVIRREHAKKYANEAMKEEMLNGSNPSSPTKSVINRSYWNLIKKSIASPSPKMISCGQVVFNTTKLFWKNNVKLLIRMFYCDTLDVITIQFSIDSTDERSSNNKIDESICLYVRKCDCPISESDVEEATHASKSSGSSCAVLLASPRLFPTRGGQLGKLDMELSVKNRVEWTLYGNYLLARLRLAAITDDDTTTTTTTTTNKRQYKYSVILTNLTGDTYDTLSVPKPINLTNPRTSLRKSTKQNMKDFNAKAKAANDDLQEMHRSCRNLQGIRSLLDGAMEDMNALSYNMELSSTASTPR